MAAIPQQYRDLFETKAFANLATLRADGTAHVSPVWIDYDGRHLSFNSTRGRAKVRQIERDPRVTFSVQDPHNPYRYVEVRGHVVETTEKGADAHVDALAKKYLGRDTYPFRRPGEVRVLIKVEPDSVHGQP